MKLEFFMSRADLIVNLVRAGTQGDQGLFRSTVEAMAAEERAKHHHQLAERLEENLREANARPKPAEVLRVAPLISKSACR